jgi:hypothetical protein
LDCGPPQQNRKQLRPAKRKCPQLEVADTIAQLQLNDGIGQDGVNETLTIGLDEIEEDLKALFWRQRPVILEIGRVRLGKAFVAFNL